MSPRVTAVLLIAIPLAAATAVTGGTEGRAQVYVQSSATDGTAHRGDRYAKCFPGDDRRSKGRTLIYKVGPDADEVEDAYDW
jgi:hypothetical protein